MHVRRIAALNGPFTLEILAERIDAAVADDFSDVVRGAIAEGHSSIVLDMSAVNFMDSSGLGALVGCLRYLGPDRSMALTGIKKPVERLLKLTRVNRVFDILPEPAD